MKKITKTSPKSKPSSIKTSFKTRPKFNIFVIIGAVLLVIAIPIALYLLGQNSDNRNQAAGQQTSCVEQCPGKDGVLRNCTPPEADGSSQDSICNQKGRVEICGGKTYVCNKPSGKWTVVTPTPAPITCGWCGAGCGPIKKNQVCPMIAAPAGYACIPDKNQKTCVKVRVDIPIRR